MTTTTTTTPPAAATRTARVRRALLAVAVVAAPALQVAGMLLHPPLAAEPAGQLAIVAEDPGRWFVAHVVAAAAAALFLVAAPALAGLVRARGAALATAGAALTVLGGATLAIAFGAEAHLLSVAADPSLDAAAMTALAALEHHSPALAMILLGVPLTGIGQLLLAAGLLRARVAPRWAPALVLVGLVASLAGAPGSVLGPALLLPAVVGYAALAVTVARR